MLEPLNQLAFSIYDNPGIYALLLGSGISRAAAIPTGWDIVQDLMGKLAASYDVTPDNIEAWYIEKFQQVPSYSALIDAFGKTSSGRKALIRQYIEPTEDEKADGIKQPTKAHRLIAKLIAEGYIKIIITTNFDRLMEQALSESGIEPIVIKSHNDIDGCLPLQHEKCVIIKVHGDYLDDRFKNTDSELLTYHAKLNKLLKTVFNEYGLIVAGWSAQWDKALISCVASTISLRFANYWLMRGTVGSEAQSLITKRHGTLIPIESADSFFSDLYDTMDAIRSYKILNPLTKQTAIATFKKYISNPTDHIKLHELIKKQTDATIKQLREINQDQPIYHDHDSLQHKLIQYEAAIEILAAFAFLGSYFGTQELYSLWLDVLDNISTTSNIGVIPPKGSHSNFLEIQRYPVMLLFYALGMGAILTHKYELLNAMFNYEIIEPINKYEKLSLVSFIYSQQHGHNSLYRVLNEMGNKGVDCNASGKYCLFITKIIEDVIISSQRIHFSFKLFEYFLSLYFAKTHLYYLGQFTFEPLFWEELEKQISETNDSGKTWLPLQNGLFNKKASLFNELANTYYKILSTKGQYFIESIGIKKIHLSN